MSIWRKWILTLAALLVGATPLVAQSVARPQPSVLWSAVPDRTVGLPATAGAAIASRSDGFAIGALIGVLAAGFAGHRICRAYGTTGDCWGNAMWWGVIGGMLGGLIGASAAEETDVEAEDQGRWRCSSCSRPRFGHRQG